MGPEYCNRFQHQNLHHHIHQRSAAIFLPMLCSRPSIKDVHGFPRNVHDKSSSSSSSSSSKTDPLSPKISCIGQVKRKNKVVVFPNPHKALTNTITTTTTATRTSLITNHHSVKYGKLKKFFSSKNLTVAGAGAGEAGRGHVAANGAKGSCGCDCKSGNSRGVISIVDLDPPLPVVKRRPIQAQQGGGSEAEAETESLWKRRSGGATLKGLQIQQIHHPRHHLQPTTV